MENLAVFWQFLPYKISPEIFTWGWFSLRWYFMGYFLGFLTVYFLLRYRFKKDRRFLGRGWQESEEKIIDSLFWIFLGLILGARLGYVFFYDWAGFLEEPLGVFSSWVRGENGFDYIGIYGMSYHGGLLGCLLALFFYCRKNGLSFWGTLNFILPAVPLGYFWGRLGNFFNGELWGRVADVPWGMYFPGAYFLDSQSFLRHPSQLYEALGEGLLLFVILWSLRNHKKAKAFLLPIYLFGYGLVRFLIEFFREPDRHLGFLGWGLTVGQWLCLVMIGTALLLGFFIYQKKTKKTLPVFNPGALNKKGFKK